MRVSLALFPAIFLAACGGDTSGTYVAGDGEEGSYTINQNGDEMTAKITSAEGTATIRSGEGLDVDLPQGYSLYPGSKIISATTMNSDENSGSMVFFESDAAPDAVIAHFRKLAEADGVEIKMEMKTGNSRILSGEGTNGRIFSITVSDDDGKSSGNLMIGRNSN